MGISQGVSTLNGVVRSFGNLVVRGGRLRKRGGQVVSYAPHVAELLGGASRAAMGVLLVGGSMVAAPTAFAGTCDSVTNICTGAANSDGEDSAIIVNIDGGTVATADGFGFDNSETGLTDPALQIISTGAAAFVDEFESAIASNGTAIQINAADAATVTADSIITSTVGDGIAIVAGTSGNGAAAVNLTGSVNASSTLAAGLNIDHNGAGGIWVNIAQDAEVIGGNSGIITNNRGGVGSTTLDVAGVVTGGAFGIYAISGAYLGAGPAGTIAITNAATGTVNGGLIGIYAQQNTGSFADIVLENAGVVTSGTWGVGAVHSGIGDIIFTNDGADALVDGGVNGLNLVHERDGDILVENLNGAVINGDTNGIYAAHVWAGNIDITNQGVVTTSNAGVGINVEHNGRGTDSDDGIGHVTITNEGQIYAIVPVIGGVGGQAIIVTRANTAIGDVTVNNSGTLAAIGSFDATTGAVEIDGQSLSEGIGVTHDGTGAISVANSGAITANWAVWAQHNGVLPVDADPETNLIDLNNTGDLSASSSALWANAGATAVGDISLTNSGTITNTSTETGVNFAAISAAHNGAGDVVINNTGPSVTATGLAIGASHDGTGNITVATTGDVVSRNANAIRAVNYGGGNVAVTAENARNEAAATDAAAISTAHIGTATTTITTNGLVSGNYSAIYAAASGGTVELNNSVGATLQNLSGLTTDLAVEVADLNGGFANATLENAGTITGTVAFGSGDDVFNNDGTWNVSGGTSDFGAGNDTLNLNTDFTAVNTQFLNLEALNIAADFDLGSGAVGQTAVTSGDVNFGEDARLVIAASLTGADKLTAGGTVALDGELAITTLGSTLGLAGTTYVIVEADSVTGSFTNDLIETSAFMAWEVETNDSTVEITYIQQRDLADAALTPNQVATADGIDSLGSGNALRDAVLHVADDAAAQSAFTQLSGELHPAIRTALIEDSRLPRNAVLGRLQDPEGGAIWGQIFGSWGEIDAHRITNTNDLDRNTYGAILGFDLPISEDVLFGLAGSYTEHDFKQNQLSSTGSGETIHALAYVGAQSGSLNLKAGIGYGWGNVETKRDISFSTRGAASPVTFASTNAAKYDAELLQVFGEIGTRLPTGGGYIEPMVNLTYIDVKTDSFAETGGVSALYGDRASERSLLSVVGTRFSTSASGPFSVRGLVGWQHAYGNLTPTSSLRFDGGDRFSIAGVQQSRNAGVVNIEGNFAYAGNSSISFGYDGVIGDHGQDHGAKMTLRIGF